MLLATSYSCETAQGVKQSTYEWVYAEPAPQGAGKGNEVDYFQDFFSSVIEPQLDLFSDSDHSVGNEALFEILTEQWHSERGSTSSIMDMITCPSYQKVIGMGEKAIPLILGRLAAEGDNPDHWFWALQALTGVNPVPEKDEGDLRGMSAAWLKWGASKGYAR